MNYTNAIIWFISWPIIIWLAYKFVSLNVTHFENMEKLEELDKK